MTRKVVAMPVIPGGIWRGNKARSDLGYAKYARASWQWWCNKHAIEFVAVEDPLGGSAFAPMPATIQRWHILERLVEQYGKEIRIAIVDADTMVRWDTPDFFDLARGFSAVAIRNPDRLAGGYASYPDAAPFVRTRNPGWISLSLLAFQHLFPGVSLSSSEYFNAGFVVLGFEQHKVMRKFLAFCAAYWPQLNAIMQSGDFGTDQTPLNLMLRQENEPVFFLPGAFNSIHCFPMDAELVRMDTGPAPDPTLFAQKAFRHENVFDFTKTAYVWHFTNVIALRTVVMRETWSRICHNYPGASVDHE